MSDRPSNEQKIAALRGQWLDGSRIPFGRKFYDAMPLSEAVQLDEAEYVLAAVAWWDDATHLMPAGYTWFESVTADGTGFLVMLDVEPESTLITIAGQEIVAVFWKNRFYQENDPT